MVEDRKQRVETLAKHQLITLDNDHIALTDTGMNIHHRICTHLLKDI
jgi:coproporphyrinogen III oxidase-like Fe-S oxidoreductase